MLSYGIHNLTKHYLVLSVFFHWMERKKKICSYIIRLFMCAMYRSLQLLPERLFHFQRLDRLSNAFVVFIFLSLLLDWHLAWSLVSMCVMVMCSTAAYFFCLPGLSLQRLSQDKSIRVLQRRKNSATSFLCWRPDKTRKKYVNTNLNSHHVASLTVLKLG